MKFPIWSLVFLLMAGASCFSQPGRESIYSEYVLYPQRKALYDDLHGRFLLSAFSLSLDSNSEYRYESACGAIAQFLISGPIVESGFSKLFKQYDSLQFETKRAFLEAVYAVYPKQYREAINLIFQKEADPKLFSMCAAYLARADSANKNLNGLKMTMVEKFPGYDSVAILSELWKYLHHHLENKNLRPPDIAELFRHQKNSGQKTIYSLQRWNRNYPGLAIVQFADGHFARASSGKLKIFQQLARSGSDLPYFITNGSTPQGIFSITGMDISHNLMIGPTPNIQLIMPFEDRWEKFFQGLWIAGADSMQLYLQLLPASWRNYQPMREAWFAGKIGRTEIIAHGTAIDPNYFKNKSFYPLTPTMGCLCAKELWNNSTGHLLLSDQFDLASTYQSTPGRSGWLYVINLDDQQRPVSPEELEKWVRIFEYRK
jgi:hypothetical protein